MRKHQSGFTLVEMLIVVIMTSIISIIIFTLGYQYLKQAAALNAQTNFYGDRLNVADYLRSNIGLSTGLINQNSLADSNRLVPDPADTTGTLWQPIHSIPGVFGNATGITPIAYYSQNAINTSNAVIMNGTVPYQNEFVIYHHGPTSELRVRSLGNTSATGNKTVTTCTLAVSGCNKDKVLLTGVKTVEMRYFSRSGEDIDYRSSCDPDIYCSGSVPSKCLQTAPYTGCNGLDFSQVEVVQFKIKVSKPIESDVNYKMFNTTVIRIALRNA
ncbi:MAG: prepilin-type N-terminal cleavage/methylation domain-containing protein [Candidatus Saccharimonadales bacterium]